jgi:hypothetical protein
MSTPNNELELMEARKASPDWIGIQVLTGLVASGSALFASMLVDKLLQGDEQLQAALMEELN